MTVDRYYLKPVSGTVSNSYMHAMIQHNNSPLGLPPAGLLAHKRVKPADGASLLGL